jgi:hypothetical protein
MPRRQASGSLTLLEFPIIKCNVLQRAAGTRRPRPAKKNETELLLKPINLG